MVLNRFHHHDSVIDYDADGEDETEKRDVINREPEGFHRCERADQGNWNRDEGNDRRAPGLEKNKHNQNDQRDGLKERLLNFLD